VAYENLLIRSIWHHIMTQNVCHKLEQKTLVPLYIDADFDS
jgi:hypothetical protein